MPATTGCPATRATTASPAVTATTTSPAAQATTRSPAATGATRSTLATTRRTRSGAGRAATAWSPTRSTPSRATASPCRSDAVEDPVDGLGRALPRVARGHLASALAQPRALLLVGRCLQDGGCEEAPVVGVCEQAGARDDLREGGA